MAAVEAASFYDLRGPYLVSFRFLDTLLRIWAHLHNVHFPFHRDTCTQH